MITSWHAYPNSFNLGHRYLTDLFKGPVNVEEKPNDVPLNTLV